jgi:long-chain acyl-CoA synthetase
LEHQVKTNPDKEFLGTRVGNKYEWMTFKETYDFAENLSYGCEALGFIPTIMTEGQDWRFMGIQSKNRKEWALTHLAGMFRRVTTVAFYDTLGPEATKFCVNQTQVSTIACTIDCATKLA